jgi:hypothetical protein
MIAFFDTEFSQGYKPPKFAEFVSIGIVREDDRSIYRVSADFKPRKMHPWFKRNCWKPILEHEQKTPLTVIQQEVAEFLDGVELLVTRNAEVDTRLMRSLVGKIPPVFDIEKHWVNVGCPRLPKRQGRHHALDDAYWHRTLYGHLNEAMFAPRVYFVIRDNPVSLPAASSKKGRRHIRLGLKNKPIHFTKTWLARAA